jgi:hypothetical protein
MPISNRTPPKDMGKTLAVTENRLRGASDSIKSAQELGLKPDEVEVLEKARDVLLDARVRQEFPVLSRVFENIKSKLEGGESLELTEPQTRALLDMMGDHSFAENEILNKLGELGVIPKDQFDSFVKEAKDMTRTVQNTTKDKAKWAFANFGNIGVASAMGYGIAFAVGGPAGALGAVAVSTIWGYTGGKKIQGAIAERAFIEGAVKGMNAAQGQEVGSELMLLTGRAATGEIFSGDGTLLDNLKREVELGKMLGEARAASGLGVQSLETSFMMMSQAWMAGLEPILEKLESGKMSEAEARQAIFEVRGKALNEATLEVTAQIALANYVQDPDGQVLALLRQMKVSSDAAMKDLKDNGGKASQETRDTVATMVMLYQTSTAKIGGVSDRGMELLNMVAKGEDLNPNQLKQFESQVVANVDKSLTDREPDLKTNKSDARKQAELAFDVLWSTVVPSFQEMAEAPTATKMNAKKLDDGSWEVTGKFKGGFLGMGSEGDFSVQLSDIGQIDVSSISIDLGEDFMKDAAKVAFETYAEQTGVGGKVSDLKMEKAGKAPDDNYVMTGKVGGKAAKVEITPMGFVAWDKLSVG